MKNISCLLVNVLLTGMVFSSCSDNWDNHYGNQDTPVDSDQLSIVDAKATEYLQSESSLSGMTRLFEKTGVTERMNGRDQLFTVLAVRDAEPLGADLDETFTAGAHVTDVSFSPANLTDGQRILMWNGKYVNVTIDETGTIFFNGVKTVGIAQVNDGYVYQLEDYIHTPLSMYETIEGLGDDYSMFREMVLSRNTRVFDRENSLPTGIDGTGSTVYDSVFVYTNPYFYARDEFDLMSESTNATMLIPSNEVIEKALDDARARLLDWGMTRQDSIVENWVFQSAFFDQIYTPEDFAAGEDLTSIFGKQWRTTVQQVDLAEPIAMSNGTAYYVTDLKIPTNVLIYRLKDFYKWYEFLTEAEKAAYYQETNLTFSKVNTDVAAWSGWPGVFPNIENRVLIYDPTDVTQPIRFDFTPFQYIPGDGGAHTVQTYRIPPGEYDLCLGFKEKMGYNIEVYFNDQLVGTIASNDAQVHYDRNGQGYPEFYTKGGKYDRDGKRIGSVVIEGTEPVEVTLSFRAQYVGSLAKPIPFTLNHWCLRPTSNCY